MLAQIADGVIIADQHGTLTFVNEAARSFFGTSVTASAAAALQRAAAASTSAVIDLEVDGEGHRVALGHAVPVQGEDGCPLCAVLTLRDVTAERMLEQRKSEFFSSMSHDLRTHVATIKGAVEVVLENEPPNVAGPTTSHAADHQR